MTDARIKPNVNNIVLFFKIRAAALRTLETKNYPPSSLVYGAHGYEAMLAEAVPQQISYLQKAEKTVRQYLLSLKGNTAKEKLAYVDYALLTKLFLHTFPAYDFDYKIKYGLHGMVEEVLASMYQEGK